MTDKDILSISIPSWKTVAAPKPYSIFNVHVKLAVKQLALEKRYSDFQELHNQLVSVTGREPPSGIPRKHIFSIVSNQSAMEERRKGLETYLTSLCNQSDDTLRSSQPFRTFLNLPLSTSIEGKAAKGSQVDVAGWVVVHKETKTLLHEARMALSSRDSVATLQESHSYSANAKKKLVQAHAKLAILESALEDMGQMLGDGEKRRRKDMIMALRNEKHGLDQICNQQNSMRFKKDGHERPSEAQLDALLPNRINAQKGRVIGRAAETERTKDLDNTGVLDLQQQIFRNQDTQIETLHEKIQRQKELGLLIGDELDSQIDLLNGVETDVDRVSGKIRVARKKINTIK